MRGIGLDGQMIDVAAEYRLQPAFASDEAAEMMAFDALPNQIRHLLRETSFKWSAIDCLKALRSGVPVFQLENALISMDAEQCQKEPPHGCA